jgi:hypothetical protein
MLTCFKLLRLINNIRPISCIKKLPRSRGSAARSEQAPFAQIEGEMPPKRKPNNDSAPAEDKVVFSLKIIIIHIKLPIKVFIRSEKASHRV